ncbi:MAG: helix-turn-helix transcriptional regulator, partial [Gammaproteobacteria bacterium]|nr:helix-turn-helix transcriptional regulator [Gammaproteobacteria bacterium]
RRIPLLIAKNERDALDRIWRLVTVPPLWISTNLRRSLLVSVLLPIITRALDKWQGPVTVDSTLQHHQVIIDAIKRHIETNLPQGTDLDTLAHISGYSKYHFSRLFKRISGEKITAFIDRCRLNRVAEMRQAGAMQKEIAAALGFASPTAFANWQRKMETPGG